MNSYSWLISTLKAIVFPLTLGLCMTACGAGNLKWKEEVELKDGRLIVIEREAIYESGGDEIAINRSGSKIKGYVIRFSQPDGSGKPTEWHSTKMDSQTYPEIPLVLEISSGQSVIYTLLSTSQYCDVYSKYVYQNNVWSEELLPKKFEAHSTNLLFADKADLPPLLKLAEKHQRNDTPGHRETLRHVGPSATVCE